MTDRWWRLAACKGADVNLFFPDGSGNSKYDIAKEYCDQCPVTAECLEDALIAGIKHGMWGGTTVDQREVIAIKRGLVTRPYTSCGDKKGTSAGYYREKTLGIPHCPECLAAYNQSAVERNRRKRERRKQAVNG